MNFRTRRIIDFLLNLAMFYTMWFGGAGWWSVLIFPFGIWSYYDGLSRGTELSIRNFTSAWSKNA